MLAFISPAKTMVENRVATFSKKIATHPRFMESTKEIIQQMAGYSIDELKHIYKISDAIALQLKSRFQNFLDGSAGELPAIFAYDGVVFKHIQVDHFTDKQLLYLQDHLRICSLLYGVLRPLDQIKPYRMEPFVRLSGLDDQRVDRFWRDIQTQQFIDDIQQHGGELVYLASKEEQNAFNWKEVKKQVKVVDVQFLQYKGDKLRTVTIYAKMARGEMVRYMVENQVKSVEQLQNFEWEGYIFDPNQSSDQNLVFVQK